MLDSMQAAQIAMQERLASQSALLKKLSKDMETSQHIGSLGSAAASTDDARAAPACRDQEN